MTSVTTGRFRGKPIEGEFVRYDGTNAAEVEAFAGSQYTGSASGLPVVRSRDGGEHVMRPGWTLSRVDGADGVTVSSPEAWAERADEAA